MSNHCSGRAYAPTEALAAKRGRLLSPFTVLCWNFLERHGGELGSNPRTMFVFGHLDRRSAAERASLRERATAMLDDLDAL